MFDRFSSICDVFIRLCLGVFVLVLSACGPMDVGATSITLPACSSGPPERNPYASHEQSEYIAGMFANRSQQDALMQLGNNMKRWSDFRNIVSDETHIVRIGITYLDPVLIQYLVLNNVLSFQEDKRSRIDITATIKKEMDKLASYDKLFFVIILTSSVYNGQTYDETGWNFSMPVETLTLVNASGMRTAPAQYDHILTETIDMSQGPIYGIVGYPVSVFVDDKCVPFIGEWNSSFTLDLDSIKLGEKTFNSVFWNIPFQPLILQDDDHIPPVYDQNYFSRFSRIDKPPIPDLKTKAGLDEATSRYYWEEMGRYLWNVLIGESGH